MIDKNKTGLNSDQRGTMFQCHKCKCVNIFSIGSCAYCGEEQLEPIQVIENKLKELLSKVDIESVDSACPDDQDECPVSGGCTECWMNYFQRTEPVSTEVPAMIHMVSDQLQIDPEILK